MILQIRLQNFGQFVMFKYNNRLYFCCHYQIDVTFAAIVVIVNGKHKQF